MHLKGYDLKTIQFSTDLKTKKRNQAIYLFLINLTIFRL